VTTTFLAVNYNSRNRGTRGVADGLVTKPYRRNNISSS
jgi:hypothetical protein